jgi:hypothetical protein
MWANDDTDTTGPALPELDHYDTESERVDFEALAKRSALELTRTTKNTNYFGADYLNGITEACWQGWKLYARAHK